MSKRILVILYLTALTVLLISCSGLEKMDLEVKAVLDGKPAPGAKVTVDGIDAGTTGADGMLVKTLEKKPGAEIAVVVTKDMPGYRIKPFKSTLLMKLPQAGTPEKYPIAANFEFSRISTIVALDKGAPVADASVLVGGAEVGRTGANGEFVYEYTDLPGGMLDLSVTKTGYAPWKKAVSAEPGQRIEAVLGKRVRVTITALTEEYGQQIGIAGATVSIDKKGVGKTNARGSIVWTYEGEPGRKVPVVITVPGMYLPVQRKATIVLEGDISLQRHFISTAPKAVRVGIYHFTGNTPNVDLKAVAAQAEEAVRGQLFKHSCFKEVPTQSLLADMKAARVTIEKAAAKGWRESSLRKSVDVIVMGSVAKDEKGLLIETKFLAATGKVIHSQIARARSESNMPGAAKDIAAAVVARFPFEGMVIGKDDDRYRINLGKAAYKIAKHDEFLVMAPRSDETGKISGYRETGRLRVKKAEDASSLAEVDEVKQKEKVAIGDRVVRVVVREEDEEKNVAVVSVKGGLPPDVSPLGGVNIYMNDEWVGTTGNDGKAEVPAAPGKKYDIVLYRHGYQQASDRIKIEKSGEVKEFTLTVNNAVFKIESQPSGAEVFVDGEKIGKTPILDGRPVTLGFHTVRVALGGDYRDWEEVVEFASKTEERTGSKAAVLHKDYLKIGERSEQRGDMDGAIAAYSSAGKGHPDYSVAHHRLAQIYLDEKSDYDAAIREFENVLTLPENQQLVYKQYAVAFTNLGHAYYEKGNALVQTNRDAAAQNFAKAIQNLQVARQNTRFFPTDHYDEAVHDTYYYTALSYHKLYLLTKKPAVLNNANLAWREYFDFFPKSLEGNKAFDQSRYAAQKYWDQIRHQQ